MAQKQAIDPTGKVQLNQAEALYPKQHDRSNRGPNRFPQTPAIRRTCQHEDKEQEEEVILPSSKNRNQTWPNHIGAVNQQAEIWRRFLPFAQEQYDEHALNNVKSQQSIGPRRKANL